MSTRDHIANLDQLLRQATGHGIADLVHDVVEASIKSWDKSGISDGPSQAPGSREEAGLVLGVRTDADPEVIEAARRVLLRRVKAGETSIGGDEQRAKRINAAADLLLRR